MSYTYMYIAYGHLFEFNPTLTVTVISSELLAHLHAYLLAFYYVSNWY